MIRREGEQPGLHVLPDWDPEFIRERLEPDGRLVCSNCGASRPSAEENGSVTCGNCGGSEWARALRARQGHAAG